MELTFGFGFLTVLALLLFKASVSATSAQRWTVVQAMTDAYMSREMALARRYPFDDFKETGTPWPTYPAIQTEVVEVGKLPGGLAVTATVRRTKFADENNLVAEGGKGDSFTNPSGMEAWRLQSLLTYTVSGRDYVKTRNVLRSR